VKSHSRRTPEEVCIEYHLAAAEISRTSEIIHSQVCDRGAGRNPSCLTEYFALPTEYDSQTGRLIGPLLDGFEGFCEGCQIAYNAVQKRKQARARLGAAKRAVGAVGKRLNVTQADSNP
jgi:hypothetical protein